MKPFCTFVCEKVANDFCYECFYFCASVNADFFRAMWPKSFCFICRDVEHLFECIICLIATLSRGCQGLLLRFPEAPPPLLPSKFWHRVRNHKRTDVYVSNDEQV